MKREQVLMENSAKRHKLVLQGSYTNYTPLAACACKKSGTTTAALTAGVTTNPEMKGICLNDKVGRPSRRLPAVLFAEVGIPVLLRLWRGVDEWFLGPEKWDGEDISEIEECPRTMQTLKRQS
ncbi:hypothetical protein FA15DRAFT_655769 [Coprinopsis marcescibilis]|uniref:Uncharacterized protein n=1 Tax=Coprinopsis marcescibilis TaxID=230819 RepID=A0A5C3KV66_COPMA|nr:hypothetical protein FA15DRAFT_655769 [Coprinopsis marcescibilis]